MTTSDDKPDTPEAEDGATEDEVAEIALETIPELTGAEPTAKEAGFSWARLAGFVILPVIALLLGAAAGFLKWEDNSRRDADTAGDPPVAAKGGEDGAQRPPLKAVAGDERRIA